MNKDPNLSSRLLTCAGGLMTLSGVLMAVCGKPVYGGILWAAALCMFFAAYHFRQKENKTMETEDTKDEETAL